MKYHMPLLLLAIIAVISIIGLVQLLGIENAGMVSKTQKMPYQGYNTVTTETACKAIHCRVGFGYPIGVDERGHIICACREHPDWMNEMGQYRVTPFRNY
ncbi:hypothetical protein GF358_04210 [Candidatus Woesearchaeota archaeon]|nr:hypothetical protein [Candidatus Woesearchaeota archaeon]